MEGLELVSTAAAVPERRVANDDLSQIMDTNDEWIFSRTGIHSRYFCGKNESTLTLALRAAEDAVRRAGIRPDEIGCVVVGTCSGDYATPGISCLVQSALGLPDDIPATDVNSACTGFVYATEVARGFLQDSDRPYALVIASEQISKFLDMSDRSTAVLFGDGAGAAVMKKTKGADYRRVLGSSGGLEIRMPGAAARNVPAVDPEASGSGPVSLKMDGKAVFRFATGAMRRGIETLLRDSGKTMEDIDWVVCHQANARIIDYCVKKLKAPSEKFFENMDHFGNTSGASIPLALNEMNEKHLLKAGQTILMVGFGSGLSWGGVLMQCSPSFAEAGTERVFRSENGGKEESEEVRDVHD
ncbi:MAG: 3-oxoacyl-ACP synthase III family protein [Bilifractor sp.]|jgi:3-oxoacyl-[acyl-carrier-protein] synthase-3